MKSLLFNLILGAVLLCPISGQSLIGSGGGEFISSHTTSCLAESQRVEINKMLTVNLESLKREKIKNYRNKREVETVTFDWPLRMKSGLNYNSYYATDNFVDQDPGPGVRDFYCGR